MDAIKLINNMKKILFILISVIISVTTHAQNWSVSSGTEIPFLVGESGGLIAGQAVYLNQLTKKVYKAEITGSKKEAIGFCSKTAAVNDTTYIVTGGLVLTWPDTLTVGAVYYLSETTPGAIRNTKPTGTYQAVGVAVDTHKMQVVIAPVRIEPAITPGLDAVTAIGSTSYNDITVSDGAFNVLTLAGTDTARIRFTDPVGEGTADLVGPPKGTMDGSLKWQFPNKSGTVAMLSDAGLPYLVYTALLTQSGTDAPVAIVLQNTLGGEVVWSRADAGWYNATLTGAFTENKTVIRHDRYLVAEDLTSPKVYYSTRLDTDTITLKSGIAETLEDDRMPFPYFFEIRVYP